MLGYDTPGPKVPMFNVLMFDLQHKELDIFKA